jgi:hypothetical protein
MFPNRFFGKESKNKLTVDLKIAAIQSGGFNLHTRSSKSSKELQNSIYDENIRLSCQSTRAYREYDDDEDDDNNRFKDENDDDDGNDNCTEIIFQNILKLF